MSKKQIIKNIQKDREDSSLKKEKDNYFKFITTLAILLIIFILTYFIMGFFYTKEIDFSKKDSDTKEDINIDNKTIMLGQIFDQSESEYYVLIYDLSDDSSMIPSWQSTYESNDNALTLYKVDSSKKFNSKYLVKDNSNKQATDLSNLKVISPTLIKINNKQITEYIEGEEEIIDVLKNN
ncbi:MAG: hypothetical protein IJ105_01850 [Bacilli bacterium]|nr:hypothetical protein [Bacilli bacterium]